MADTVPFAFTCEGGLVLNRSTFIMEPGQALELTNFEPDIEGGYRRINGFKPHINQIVPEDVSSSESVLMVALFSDYVLAARGKNIWSSASTELSVKILSIFSDLYFQRTLSGSVYRYRFRLALKLNKIYMFFLKVSNSYIY